MRTGTARQGQLERAERILCGSRPITRWRGRLWRGRQRPAVVMVLAPLLGLAIWLALALVIL